MCMSEGNATPLVKFSTPFSSLTVDLAGVLKGCFLKWMLAKSKSGAAENLLADGRRQTEGSTFGAEMEEARKRAE